MGRGKAYPEGLEQYVIDHYMEYTLPELTELVNGIFGTALSKSAMSSLKKRKGLAGAPRAKPPRLVYSEETIDFVRKNCKGKTRSEMQELLKKELGLEFTLMQVKYLYRQPGVHSGITGCFVKGQPSHNKGKKMTEEQKAKIAATMFKKGSRPHNAQPVGTEIINEEGYHVVKVAEPNKWVFKHRLIWKEHYGEIPKGMNIVFKDGNKDHLVIENLVMLTNAESAYYRMMNLRNENLEIADAGIALTKLNMTARKIRQERKKNG